MYNPLILCGSVKTSFLRTVLLVKLRTIDSVLWIRYMLKKSSTFLFLFSNKMLVIKAGIYTMFVRIANREDPGQTASSSKSFSKQIMFRILGHLP